MLLPLGTNPGYDPDEPEGTPKSRYVSKRDFVLMVSALVAILLMLTPVYFQLVGQRNKVTCSQRLKGLYDALSLYAADNEDMYPPAFYDNGGGEPVTDNGLPITWASMIQGNLGQSTDWFCPESKPEERSKSAPFQGDTPISLSYGLYIAFQGRLRHTIASPSQTIMIAETATNGAKNTFNPKPLGSNDGFLIAYSSGNDSSPFTTREATHVTRLAFEGTKSGVFNADQKGRHGQTVQVIFGDGSLGSISADDAAVTRRTALEADLIGLWSSR